MKFWAYNQDMIYSGNMALGLRLADWPGRTQMVEKGRLQE